MSSVDPSLLRQLSQELTLPESGIASVIALFAEGGTVPFIARYRKEATGGLDEVQIRLIEERHQYLTELVARRKAILAEVESQGKLTEALRGRLDAATTKAELEDLYLPFKPKRRTKAMIARERGLEPLAELLWAQGDGAELEARAAEFVSAEKDVPDIHCALAGARDIVAERLSEDPELRKSAREVFLRDGILAVEKAKAYVEQTTKFDNYKSFSEPVQNIASHRYLAIRRGETEGILRATLNIDEEAFVAVVERRSPLRRGSPCAAEMATACRDAAHRLLLPSAQVDVRVELKLRADAEAIDVFAKNLRELLMAPPFGAEAVLGIDPGQRTGCKCAIVDSTGRLLAHDTIYLVQGEAATRRAEETLFALLKTHPVRAIAIGNGTHGRETEAFVKQLVSKGLGADGEKRPLCIPVSEAGASIYSASDVAREEFPDLDLTVRGAISIARRLQDPLAELVKIDPKSIGVGQYQHDVFQTLLGKKLDSVVESCVHEVGVELNTASAPLLSRVSGLGPTISRRIVQHRNLRGAFTSRKQLLDVTGLGPRAFEQAAGFLRIFGAENPLDASAVHPERYALVESMARDLNVPVAQLIGKSDLLGRLDSKRYVGGDVGDFTVKDILSELQKPGRDPRKTFEAPRFREDVNRLEDLTPGMTLEGVVTNVTAFGAFVDIGVHQDGLVHISRLSDRFIKDPSEVAKVGDRVTVRVLEVDLERKRISLSARKDEPNAPPGALGGTASAARGPSTGAARQRQPKANQGPARSGPSGGTSGGDLTHNPFAALMRR